MPVRTFEGASNSVRVISSSTRNLLSALIDDMLLLRERTTDPDAVADSGLLYTKEDGGGTTQVFARASDGTVSQLSGAGGPPAGGGWTDDGTTVRQTTSTDVVAIGTAAAVAGKKLTVENSGANKGIRFQGDGAAAYAAGDRVVDVFLDKDDANAGFVIDLDAAGQPEIQFGAGGATALDTSVRRGAANRLELGSGDSADVIAGGRLEHRTLAADANPTVSIGASAVNLGPGGITATDVSLDRSALTTLRITATVVLPDAGGRDMGATGTRWDFFGATTDFNGQQIEGFVTKVFADSPYTILATDRIVRFNPTGGASQVNLPAATGSGRTITIKHNSASTNTLTVDADAAETIDGALTQVLTSRASIVVLDAAAGIWEIIG